MHSFAFILVLALQLVSANILEYNKMRISEGTVFTQGRFVFSDLRSEEEPLINARVVVNLTVNPVNFKSADEKVRLHMMVVSRNVSKQILDDVY